MRWCLNHPASAPSAPATPILAAALVSVLKPQFDAVLAKMDQRPAWLLPPIEASGRFWPRTRWGGGLLGGVWGAEVTIGVGLLALRWA